MNFKPTLKNPRKNDHFWVWCSNWGGPHICQFTPILRREKISKSFLKIIWGLLGPNIRVWPRNSLNNTKQFELCQYLQKSWSCRKSAPPPFSSLRHTRNLGTQMLQNIDFFKLLISISMHQNLVKNFFCVVLGLFEAI